MRTPIREVYNKFIMDNDQFSSRRGPVAMNTTKNSNKMWLWIVIIVLLIAVGVGAYFFMNREAEDSDSSSITPTSSFPTDKPSPTEEDVDLEAYEIMVLNGSETAGEAGRLKTALEEAGFKVAGTGNADKTDYTETIVQAKSTVSKGYLDKLREELEGTYELTTNVEELDDDDENDVVVIIGMESEDSDEASDEADTEATATPSPTDTP